MELLAEKIKRLEKTVSMQEAELLRSRQMATLGILTSGLAHEIIQPLQIILATAQNCQRDIQRNKIDTKIIFEDLEQIAGTTTRIVHIINRLYDLSQDSQPLLETVDVNTTIENVLMMFCEQFKSRGINIKKQFTTPLPPIKADQVQLEQVFINLISNARDALEGCFDNSITISTHKQNGKIQIRFEDNGVGIAPAQLPNLFDAFFTTKEKGRGLGLYISHEIIQSYDGIITVDSQVNKGSTFVITFPIATEENTA
jgi:signal transduction histidine kinase